MELTKKELYRAINKHIKLVKNLGKRLNRLYPKKSDKNKLKYQELSSKLRYIKRYPTEYISYVWFNKITEQIQNLEQKLQRL